jgi:hypothetical protein
MGEVQTCLVYLVWSHPSTVACADQGAAAAASKLGCRPYHPQLREGINNACNDTRWLNGSTWCKFNASLGRVASF